MVKRPYIIYVSHYRHNCGGIKVLHYLCHLLNDAGYDAYVTGNINPVWNEKFISEEEGRKLIQSNAIVVYPEVIKGNPLLAKKVVRYILNVPGLLGGDLCYNDSEMKFVHSESLSEYASKSRILKILTLELDIFQNYEYERNGTLSYLGKGNDMERIYIEQISKVITLVEPSTREDLADWFNKADVLHCFDNFTDIINESRLCGCPVRLYPRGIYSKEKLIELYGAEGLFFDDYDFVNAKQTVNSFREKYLCRKTNLDDQLKNFIRITQEW